MKTIAAVCLAVAVSMAIRGCGSDEPVARSASYPAVTIMAFNVQNLFDNVDDPGKDDKAYLPYSAKQNDAHIAECNTIEVESWRDECLYLDWSDAAVEHKLSVVAAAILQVDDGRGADVVALQEVENLAILERLRTGYLADAGYGPGILLEGTDARGIDVAFLTRLPVVSEPELHALDLPEEFADREGDTRGVLEATFELPDGSRLTGFSVHFPAPFHPTPMRVAAYEHLDALKRNVPPDHNVFAAGDFNTTSTEDAELGMLDRFVRPSWQVSNDYCGGCRGTQYYAAGESWSFLDMVLYAPARGEKTTWHLRTDSVAIANDYVEQVTADGKPNRYVAAQQKGVSDHWPVVVTIEAAEIQ